MQILHVIHESFSVGTKPQAERTGHCHLQMRVAWHEHVLVPFRLRDEFVEEVLHQSCNLLDLVADEQLQIHQHLVVAASARMNLLADVAEFAGQQHLHLRVDVLHSFLNHKFAPLRLLIDGLQFPQEHLQFVCRQQVNRLQHRDVCHRPQYIIFSQIEVHLAVSAHGELLYLLRH